MFMYSYCYVCSVLCILFHCVVLCTVYVYMSTVLLLTGVNPIAISKYIISLSVTNTENDAGCESLQMSSDHPAD